MSRLEIVRCAGPWFTAMIALLSLLFGVPGAVFLTLGTQSWLLPILGIAGLLLAVGVWRSFVVLGFGRVLRNPSFGLPLQAADVRSVHVRYDELRVESGDGFQQIALVKGSSMNAVECGHRVADAIARAAGHTRNIEVVVAEPHES